MTNTKSTHINCPECNTSINIKEAIAKNYQNELSKEEIDMKQGYAKDLLYKAGAHYVIETIADIEAVIDDINKRLSRGEGP